MRFSVAQLLMHGDAAPVEARAALRAAYEGPVEQRTAHLEAAARVLYRQTELACSDARELVGLPDGTCDC